MINFQVLKKALHFYHEAVYSCQSSKSNYEVKNTLASSIQSLENSIICNFSYLSACHGNWIKTSWWRKRVKSWGAKFSRRDSRGSGSPWPKNLPCQMGQWHIQKLFCSPIGENSITTGGRRGNIPGGGALARLDAPDALEGGQRHDLIAYNDEYDDSDVQSNYGSRYSSLIDFCHIL